MKQLRFFEKIIVSAIVALLLIVVITGIWVYVRLSEVANRPLDSDKNNVRISILKELNNNLLIAENYTYTYLFRNEPEIVQQFYILRTKTDFKIAQLASLESDDPSYHYQIQNIKKYVQKKFLNMQILMRIQNENRVDETMTLVESELKTATKPIRSVQSSASENPKKKSFFRRKSDPEKTVQTITIDNSRSINSTLQTIKENVVTEEQDNNIRKLEIEKENNKLTERINQISNRIAERDKLRVLEESEKTKTVAAETNKVILLFSIFTALFLIFVFYMFLVSFKRTNAANRELKLAKDKSDQLTDAKSRFLATMSHELRTPLHAILGFSENLASKKLKEEDHKIAAYIHRSAAHLTQITNEILDLSKINTGTLTFEQIHFNPREEIEFVVSTLQETWSKFNNEFTRKVSTQLNVTYLGDPLRFRQILFNLLNNANKFTKDGKISLYAHLEEKTDELHLVCSIKDTGIGIAATDIDRVFNEFEQAEKSTARNYGGTGLGLPITKALIEQQGGNITVKSDLGQGAKFTFHIPLTKVEENATAKEPTQNDNSMFIEKKILVVDDEPFNRKIIASILRDTETILTEASNGKEALAAIEKAEFDLILMDLRMPEMDGFQTKIELDRKQIQTPIVALTATLTDLEKNDLLQNGWSGVLIKPYQAEQLYALMADLLNKQ